MSPTCLNFEAGVTTFTQPLRHPLPFAYPDLFLMLISASLPRSSFFVHAFGRHERGNYLQVSACHASSLYFPRAEGFRLPLRRPSGLVM